MSTTGTPLNLNLFASGVTGWGANMDANFSILNAAIAALQAGGTTGPVGPDGPAGPVGMIYAGAWVSTTAYVAPDVVTYNGSSYIAIANNSNKAPDVNPSTWEVIAAAGVAGPAGPTGPDGPAGAAGSGSTVSFPISIADGGTGATNAATALANLGGVGAGPNTSITSLGGLNGGITIGVTPGGDDGYLITLPGPGGNITAIGNNGIDMSGGIICGSVQASGFIETNAINPGTEAPIVVSGELVVGAGLVVQGTPGSAAAGQLFLGGGVASTATAGGGQAVPPTVLTYIPCTVNISGTSTPGKLAVFAP